MKPALGLALFLAGVVAPPAGAAEPDALARETREHLKALVRLDTSNPPGNEILAARYLKAQLDKEGIPSAIYTSTGARSSLIARLK
ncbi:MAG: peptidase M20, partial [Elusimicrobiota bacterium]